MEPVKRRLQLTGGFTYVVSLPKKWVRELGLKQGDYVLIVPQPDMSLLLVPDRVASREGAREEAILGPVRSPEECIRNVLAAYLAGYDAIRIGLPRIPEIASYVDAVKKTVKYKLIGAEIMDESADEIYVRCLLRHADLSLKDALGRMYAIVRTMCIEIARAVEERDSGLLHGICARDDEVDRFYFFVLRQLGEAIRDRGLLRDLGLSSAHECLEYQLIARCLERIADHASRASYILKDLLQSLSEGVSEMLGEMCSKCVRVLDAAMRALRDSDTGLANRAMAEMYKVQEVETALVEEVLAEEGLGPETMLHLRLVLESLRRIAEYGADIAEIAIDLAVLSKRAR